jgi:gliding motility-associated-like protein
VLLLLSRVTSYATHLAGGEINYEYVGSNQYIVTLKLFMDCLNGSTQAIQSDAQAIVSAWNANTNNFITSYTFNRTGPKYLSKSPYKCMTPPRDACVAEYTYTRTITINPGSDGVILAFERCCRNSSIYNVVAPGATGAVIWTTIPGTTKAATNSSPVFKELPPNYLCVNVPLQFDHSATDADGDSLAYELYTPYDGASKNNPRPTAVNTFTRPPFRTIAWSASYNQYNQIPADPAMEINARSGIISMTPNQEGMYVVGILVKEFRDGVHIGTTRRDYQFHVRTCRTTLVPDFETTAGGGVNTYICSDTVDFVNKSQKAASFFWDFGDPTRTDDTSSEEHPRWIYPGNGDYLAVLTAKNEVCEDQFKFLVRVRSTIDVELGPDKYFCSKVRRYISPQIYDATKIAWNTGSFGVSILAQDTGLYTAEVFYGQCKGSDSVRMHLDPVEFEMLEDTLFCTEEEVDMTLSAGINGPDISYIWSTSFQDTSETIHTTEPGIYWVRVSNEHCFKVDSTEILIAKPDLPEYFFVCNEFKKEFEGGKFPNASYLWSNGSTERYNNISTPGLHWVQVTYRHCVVRDTMFIDNPVIDLELGNDTNYCDNLARTMVAPPSMFSYKWQDGSGGEQFNATQPGKYYVYVVDTNGCDKSDTINLTMTQSPVIDIGDDTTLCVRSTAVYGDPQKFPEYNWSTGETTQYVTVQDSGKLILEVIDLHGCMATDSVYVAVNDTALPNQLFIPSAFSPNDDNLNEYFPYSLPIPQPEYHVRIYSRWGEKIFDSMVDGQQWDGTYKGKPAEQETYLYQIRYKACNGEVKYENGTVTLMK